MLHQSLGLVEGHRTMALTLLAAVAVGLTLMAGATPLPVEATPTRPRGLVLWLAAIAIGRHGDPAAADEALAGREAGARTRHPLSAIAFGKAWGEAAALD